MPLVAVIELPHIILAAKLKKNSVTDKSDSYSVLCLHSVSMFFPR